MYKNMEKEYHLAVSSKDFDKYYWKWTIIIVSLFLILSSFIMNVENYVFLVHIAMFIISAAYFAKDFHKTIKLNKIKGTWSNKLQLYKVCKNTERKSKLLLILKKYGFTSKDNLKIAIDYYNKTKPISVESSFLGWLVSALLTLTSFIEIAYDQENQVIDYTKISVIFGSSLGMILAILIPVLLIKFIFNNIKTPKEKLYSNIEEDLTIIYINFNKYKEQLNSDN